MQKQTCTHLCICSGFKHKLLSFCPFYFFLRKRKKKGLLEKIFSIVVLTPSYFLDRLLCLKFVIDSWMAGGLLIRCTLKKWLEYMHNFIHQSLHFIYVYLYMCVCVYYFINFLKNARDSILNLRNIIFHLLFFNLIFYM